MSIIRPNTNDGSRHQNDSVFVFVPKVLVGQNMVNRSQSKMKSQVPIYNIDSVDYRLLEVHRHDIEGSDIWNGYTWYEYEDALTIAQSGTGVDQVYQNQYAFQVDGVNQYLEGGTAYDFGRTTAFTTFGWIKCSGATNDVIIGRMTSNTGWQLEVTSTGYLRGKLGASGLDQMNFDGNVLVDTGSYIHCAMVYKGTGDCSGDGAEIYTNLVKNTLTINNNGSTVDWAGARNFRFGANNSGNYLATLFDEWYVVNKACSLSELGEAFNSGTPSDPEDWSFYNDVVGDWRFGDHILDDGTGSSGVIKDWTGTQDLTPYNTSASNIVSDAA